MYNQVGKDWEGLCCLEPQKVGGKKKKKGFTQPECCYCHKTLTGLHILGVSSWVLLNFNSLQSLPILKPISNSLLKKIIHADIRKQPDEHGIWTSEAEAPAENNLNQRIQAERAVPEMLLDPALFMVSAVFLCSRASWHLPVPGIQPAYYKQP